MGVKASDGSGWSSENNPFGDNDNRDERIGSDDNSERGNLTDRNGNPQADFSKTPEKQAVAAVSLITVPAQLAMVEGT